MVYLGSGKEDRKTVKRFSVYGIVQGVGFRPFVKRTADRLRIRGSVINRGSHVEILASGGEEELRRFSDALLKEAPQRAVILRILEEEEDAAMPGDSFSIEESISSPDSAYIPPDIGICDECSRELFDKASRRYLHPFINCTQCGPRFTILKSLPYDRERTSMNGFRMCPVCGSEFADHSSRMFDAQPVCCNECGPSVYIIPKAAAPAVCCSNGVCSVRREEMPSAKITGTDAIHAVRKVIMEGGIAAVKGIGGFHLCCDAKNEEAVKKLRKRKTRPAKPFALMMKDMAAVKKECFLDKEREQLLTGYQKPILLLKRLPGSSLPEILAPGNPGLGVMLPYTPVHLLLFGLPDGLCFTDALVMTSGNRSGAPITINDEEALRELSGITDIFLSNDREILERCDDSVLDVFEGKPFMIRRSRGFAPLPLRSPLSGPERSVLSLGGDLKNTFSVAAGENIYPSAHIGDLSDLGSLNALKSGISRMTDLLGAEPDLVVSDLHPRYYSTSLSASMDKPCLKVQHHYAHILSCMAENGVTGPVIGAAFDGTGYGEDGTIWGSEVLLTDTRGFRRLSHIKPFKQPGGDASSREGWRIAVSLILDAFGRKEGKGLIKNLGLCEGNKCEAVISMLDQNINVVMSTSAGRLFDAVSAVLGISTVSSYEGESAMLLQFEAEKYADTYGIPEDAKDLLGSLPEKTLLQSDLLFKEITLRRLSGEDPEKLALIFTEALALLTASDIYCHCKEDHIDTAALSGGCFQNLMFQKMVKDELIRHRIRVLTHSLIPANDGGISVGQAYYGLNALLRDQPGAGTGHH